MYPIQSQNIITTLKRTTTKKLTYSSIKISLRKINCWDGNSYKQLSQDTDFKLHNYISYEHQDGNNAGMPHNDHTIAYHDGVWYCE